MKERKSMSATIKIVYASIILVTGNNTNSHAHNPLSILKYINQVQEHKLENYGQE